MGGEGFESLEIDDPVDVNTMGGEVFESLGIDDPVPGPSSPLVSARGVEKFIDGQYFHVPRANLGPETLSRHSKWCPISCVTLLITLAGTRTDSDFL
jgi:hypothetical protein